MPGMDFPPVDVLSPVLEHNALSEKVLGNLSKLAVDRGLKEVGLIGVQLDEMTADSLALLQLPTPVLDVSQEEFIDFVTGIVEKLRSRSLAPGSIYAIRVRVPSWFDFSDEERRLPHVPGAEVGSMLGPDILGATDPAIVASLRAFARGADEVEVALGHSQGHTSVIMLRLGARQR